MKESQSLVQLVLKALALAMGVAVALLSVLSVLPLQTSVVLLGIGLSVLAVATFGQGRA
jgi:hypothetical protein